ncbi:MAG: hypothetical protein K0S08_1759 [Gammaproteobacteria bacterium]|jgi:hypothetical protein|nr:hypothetical protein [Gammaproteobacteria bacterium]
MILTYILYSVILFLLFTNAFLDCIGISKRLSLCLAGVTVLFLIVLAGIRYGIGSDYFAYYNDFFLTDSLDISNAFSGYNEFGLTIVAQIIKAFGGSVYYYFLSFSVLEGYLLWIILKRFIAKPNVALFVFYALFYFILYFNVVRQGVAVLAFVLTVLYLDEKKYKNAVLWGVIGFLFHRTILFAILINFLIKKIKLTKPRMFSYSLASAAMSYVIFLFKAYFNGIFALIDAFFETQKYAGYVIMTQDMNYLGVIFFSLFAFGLLYLMYDTLKEKSNIFSLVFWGACLQIILLPFGYYIERLSIYFIVFLPLLVSEYFYFRETLSKRLFMLVLILFTSIVYFGYGLTRNSGGVVPYKTIFFELSDNE